MKYSVKSYPSGVYILLREGSTISLKIFDKKFRKTKHKYYYWWEIKELEEEYFRHIDYYQEVVNKMRVKEML